MALTDKIPPEWNAPGIEPPDSKKNTGFEADDLVPAGWLNWFMAGVSAFLQDAQENGASTAWVQEQINKISITLTQDYNSTDTDTAISGDAVRRGLATKQDTVRLGDNWLAASVLVNALAADNGGREYPNGFSFFKVSSSAGGWPTSNGYVVTMRAGSGGFQLYFEMYTGAVQTDKTSRFWYRSKRDSNAFWQDWTRTMTEVDLAAHAADYVKHPADGGTTGGTASIYTVASTPNPAAFVDRMGIVITAHVDSAVNPQLAWGTLAPKNLVKANGSPAVLKKDGIYTFRYNLAKGNFVLQGEGGEYGKVTAEDVKSGVEFGTETGIKLGTATLFQLSSLVGGDGLSISSTSIASATTTTLVKKKEVKINQSGTVRTRFELTASAYGASAQIFKNDVAVGTLRSVSGNQTATYTEDINVVKGDYIQLFVKASDSNYAASVRNFSVSVALSNDMLSMLGTVIL